MTAPVDALRNAWATAPGKVIVTGEHAVVYGQPALAAAINRLSTANLTWYTDHTLSQSLQTSPCLTLAMPQVDLLRCISLSELQQLSVQVAVQHEAFLAGKANLSELFERPEDLLLAALGYAISANSLTIDQHLTIELQTDLLLGGGMGSSASLMSALVAVLLTACGVKFSNQQLVQYVLVAEQWQHGRSSGLDPQVCVQGGLQSFQAGQAKRLDVSTPEQLYLVTSGKPRSSTGECVELVRQQQHPAEFWQQFADLENAIETVLLDSNITHKASLVELLKINHRLLQSLQVVPEKVAAFITQVEQSGGAGKICGAGSISGEQGGLLLLAGISDQQIHALCDQAGYEYWPLKWQQQGVAYGVQ